MHSSHYEAIQVHAQDGVGWITLNRPDAINAINDAMRREVPLALRTLDDDPEVRVIMLRGAGARGFCAGADLKEERTAVTARDQMAASSWIQAFDCIDKPLIAAIHGYCLGGGLEIALACDLRLASAEALFGLPETGLGLIPGGGGTQRLTRVVGLGRALDLLISADRIGADEAYRIGLVTRLSSTREALASEAAELATRIAQRPPTAIQSVKKAAKTGMELEIDAGFRLERELYAKLLLTDERREAAAAFREKRMPVFNQK
jgi:enoyl-CoA hydratase/carnithine racemase